MATEDASLVIRARDATGEAFASAAANLGELGARAHEVTELMHQLASAFAIHEIADFIGRAIEARAKLDDLADIAGTTPEEFSKFEQPAVRAGLGLDTVAQAAARLSKSIGEAKAGNVEKASFLRSLGVDPETATDASQALETVLRSLQGVTDKNEAAFVSNELLSRSYAELRPFMKEISQLSELRATTSNEEIERAKQLTKEYADLKLQIDLQVRTMAEGLLPTLHSIIGAFSDTTSEAEDLSEKGEVLATFLKIVASLGLATVDTFYALGHTIAQVAASAMAAAQGDFRGAAVIWEEANNDIARHTEETNKRIDGIWKETAHNVQKLDVSPAHHDSGANKALSDALHATIEFQKNYPALMAKEQAFTQQMTAEFQKRAALIQEQARRGEIDARQSIVLLSENEQKRLNEENNALQRELALARQKGDLLKQQEIKSAIDRNNAAIETNTVLTASRLKTFDLLEDQAYKQRVAREVTNIQLENLTEKQKIEQGYTERLNSINNAERLRLIGAQEAARQRELVELKHQAALGNIEAQGILARRHFDELDARSKVKLVAGTLADITASVATNNRAMFEINKVASIANATINTYEGVTKALSAYPPPLSFIMAAVQLAAGLAQVQQIQSASFGGGTSAPSIGGGTAAPTYQAPNLGQSGQSSSQQDPVTVIHFHGTNKDEEETARRLIDSLNEASRNGSRVKARFIIA